ncbi:MAG: hypothetical protein ATN36_04940 [Epulopiscium sp. Nele67-Bin005]|nr:MAG: hypothetical protein ATN36_04940 [Epulopiscium sp. Nele67-Bin005]
MLTWVNEMFNDTMHITKHGWRYITRTIWAIHMTENQYNNIFCQKERKENACFCAVVEEVKHWKTLKH